MRHLVLPCYWLTANASIVFVLLSLSYSFAEALMLAAMFLPGMFCARYFIPRISFSNRGKGILHTLCLLGATLFTVYLALMLAYSYLQYTETNLQGEYTRSMPALLANPFFILLILTAAVVPEMLLEKRLARKYPRARTITFTSDRRKISLPDNEIEYVVSNDSEVHLHTLSGEIYRTKTRISQWEGLLGEGFLRVHRSYIVSMAHITRHNARNIWIGSTRIDISRKYQDHVHAKLEAAIKRNKVLSLPDKP